MPAYRDDQEAQFVKEARDGETDLTRRLQVMFAERDRAKGHDHWAAFCTEGHMDTLCLDCIAVLGMPPFIVKHLDDWDAGQKELTRATVKAAIEQGIGLRFEWMLTDGPDNTDVTLINKDGKERFNICFYANRQKMIREMRGEPEYVTPF